jgi:hypothetical protein
MKASLSPATVWYKDADNDGYSDSTNLTQCIRPAGYKLSSELKATSGDCNDANAKLNPATVWYKDADNDGYSDDTKAAQCMRPAGFKLLSELKSASGDCDDNNATLIAIIWYKDADDDGYSDGTRAKQCARPAGYKLSSELKATRGDCDDNNATLNPATVWYKDADNDGFSDGRTIIQCARPAGYKLASELITLQLYPNPTNGQFVIKLHVPGNMNATAKIELVNLIGQTVATESGNISNGTLLKTMFIPSSLNNGMYILKIVANNRRYVERLIYQK